MKQCNVGKMHGSLPDSGFFAVNLDINLGGHFLLTDAFKKTTLQNGLIEVGTLKKPASINTD
jgi:hypothetical protein